MAVKKKAKSRDPRKGVQSVEVAARVLLAVAEANGPVKLKDIAAALDISASRTHGYLVSLVRANLVTQDVTTGRYDLGEMARRLGLAALNRIDMLRVVDQSALRLRELTGLTVAVCLWNEHGPVVVRWIRGERPLAINVNVGSILPLLGTAMGRVFVAYLAKHVTRPLVDAELQSFAKRKSPLPLRTRADVDRLADEIHANGFAQIEGTLLLPDMGAVAAPIFDAQGQTVAALSLLGREIGGGGDGPTRELVEAARTVSGELGFARAG